MVIATVNYIFKEDDGREKFLKLIKDKKIQDKTKQEKGCIMYDYYFPVDGDKKVLFLLEEWETLEAQKEHMTTDHFKELAPIKEAVKAETKLNLYEVK